jgi:hypothetical protein
MRPPLAGTTPMSYSEILRVIGRYADRSQLVEVRILETDEGMILQGVVRFGERTGQLDTYQLSVEDIEDLRRDAHAQRGKLI